MNLVGHGLLSLELCSIMNRITRKRHDLEIQYFVSSNKEEGTVDNKELRYTADSFLLASIRTILLVNQHIVMKIVLKRAKFMKF